MRKFMKSNWIWYLVLGAVITGLFAPTMVANAALVPVDGRSCPIPARPLSK